MPDILGSDGQVIIKKSIREALKLQPGSIVIQKLVDDHIEVYFFPPDHTQSLRGILADDARPGIDPDRWPSQKEAAWKENIQAQDDENGSEN
jgi:bifunctional DNA-binding transcriptional regulator/antitoxin component of YhaV-PrlF toxin-antitoxin module